MRQTLKAKWVKALRSGKYAQGLGRLYRSDKNDFCCLGVLCIAKGAKLDRLDGLGFPWDYWVPGRVDRPYADLIGEEDARALAVLNDRGVPFEMIAGLINEAM